VDRGDVQARSFAREIVANRPVMLLWTGESISYFGDAFFNIAVSWTVYASTGSAFQTALIQVVWHLSDAIFGAIAGAVADRWDRKRIMVGTNFLAAVVVAILALIVAFHGMQVWAALAAIFLINCLTTFLRPARASVLPTLVDRSLFTTVLGWFSTAREIATLVGQAAAGIVVAAGGVVWALVVDALSFLTLSGLVAMLRLPGHPPVDQTSRGNAMWHDLREGWQVIAERPVVRSLVWLSVLVNVASYLGPLYPKLVDERLNGGATALGLLGATSVSAAIVAGAVAGAIERRLGAGGAVIGGWTLAGLATIGIAFSTSLPLTVVLDALNTFGLTVSGVAAGALGTLLIPDQFRGRAFGITRSLSVLAIPPSALLGGWLADQIGVMPLFTFGGCYMVALAFLVWRKPEVRTARIG
jgi:DHA3 family macrolide efflux protein-like MFS transporter